MKRTVLITKLLGIVAVAFALTALFSVGDDDDARAPGESAAITGFTALEVKGKCKIEEAGTTEYVDIKIGVEYAFGSTIKTMRKSFVELQFSANNKFRLLARTTLKINQDTRNPKLKIVKLESGQVELELDDFPRDHSLKVETPTAVCGAVGTRFVVAFEDNQGDAVAAAAKKGGRENRFNCSQGEVHVASRFSVDDVTLEGDTLDIPGFGAGTEIVAVIHEGKENSYTDISVNRGKLTFNYGDDDTNTLVVDGTKKRARFVCALEKSDDTVPIIAMKVEEGEVTNVRRKRFGDDLTVVSDQDETVVIKKKNIGVPKKNADKIPEKYIAAAKKEGELHSQLVDLEAEPVPDVLAIDKLTVEVDAAAKDATRLRNLLTKRSRKMIRFQRQVNRMKNPGRMRR
jgi:hypothetical protein